MSGGWHKFTTLPEPDMSRVRLAMINPDDWAEERARRVRRHKVELLLDSVDLTPLDFLAWLEENHVKRTPEQKE